MQILFTFGHIVQMASAQNFKIRKYTYFNFSVCKNRFLKQCRSYKKNKESQLVKLKPDKDCETVLVMQHPTQNTGKQWAPNC